MILNSIRVVIFTALVATIGEGQNLPKEPRSGGVLEGGSKDSGDFEESLEQTVDGYAKFDLDEIEKTVEAFLNAATVSERAKYVRDSERVLPLMKSFYEGEKIEPEGFKELVRSQVSYRGNILSAEVETGDYSSFSIVLIRMEGDVVSYRVDWESWVGFCEVKPEKIMIQRPVDPVLVRALVKTDRYFNFDFSDEKEWKSHQLTFRNSEAMLSGYAKVNSTVAKSLQSMHRDDGYRPFVLKVVYPKGGRSESQVEIVEIVNDGWFVEEAEKADQKK